MKKDLSWFDKMMIAVTFAESNAAEYVMDIGVKHESKESTPAEKKSRSGAPKISAFKRLATLFKAFEDAMAATAFAEAGEHQTAHRIYLQGKNARKRVLLGTDDQEIDLQVIGYALNLCQRVEAGLEVIHLVKDGKDKNASSQPSGVKASPKQLQAMLGNIGVDYRPVEAKTSLENELVSQVNSRRDILFVVVGAQNGGKDKKHKSGHSALARAFGRLKCPLVVYEQVVPAS